MTEYLSRNVYILNELLRNFLARLLARRLRGRKFWALWLLVGLGIFSACGDDPVSPSMGNLVVPLGMTLAGPQADYLFIANSGQDSLNILHLAPKFSEANFVTAPAIYFPLQIPTMAHPNKLIATKDGKNVLVLDTAAAVVQLVHLFNHTESTANGGKEWTPEGSWLIVRENGTAAPLANRQNPSPPLQLDLSANINTNVANVLAAATDIVLATKPLAGQLPGCLGRLYVSLLFPDSTAGRIAVIDVYDPEQLPAGITTPLVLQEPYVVTGAPTHLAIDSAENFLYMADALAAEVARLDLTSSRSNPSLVRVDIGALGGVLAVSSPEALASGKSLLLVSRPSLQDVLLLDDATGTNMVIYDVNAAITPLASCLRDCSELTAGTLNSCSKYHPADSDWCVNPDASVELKGTSYQGIYVGMVPTKIKLVGQSLGFPPFIFNCLAGGQNNSQIYSDIALLSGLDGKIYYVGLTDLKRALQPKPLFFDDCLTPNLAGSFVSPKNAQDKTPLTAAALKDFMMPCPVTNSAARHRLACVQASDAANDPLAAGVNILPGYLSSANYTIDLAWEGEISGLENRLSGGELDNTGRFTDTTLDLSKFDIQPQDILEIMTTPRVDNACKEALGIAVPTPGVSEATRSVKQCIFERRIVALEKIGERTWLQLAPREGRALPSACFNSVASLAYRIRVGDSFMVKLGGDMGAKTRLQPLEQFGFGGKVFKDWGLSFRLADQAGAKALSNSDPCSLYDETGEPLGAMPAYLTRSRLVRLALTFPDTNPIRGGLDSDHQERAIGMIPGDLIIYPDPRFVGSSSVSELVNDLQLWVTYAGSNSLLVFNPWYSDKLLVKDNYRLFH